VAPHESLLSPAAAISASANAADAVLDAPKARNEGDSGFNSLL
jgi:hypothetical protein